MPSVTKSRNLKIAFLLDKQLLKRIDSILKQAVSGEIKYALSCSDGSSFEFSSIEDVFNKRWGQVSTFDIRSRIEMNFCHENTTKVEDIQLQLLIKRSGFKTD